ncbi:MAG TPA: ROK family protein [Acidimicrobiales bacterium]|nr:ROK family protein [Acidimicrobiales bacterium]
MNVGVDVGGSKVLAVALDGAGVLRAEARAASTVAPGDFLHLVETVVAQVTDGARPDAVGIGLPGLVDDTGTLRFSPHLPDLVGLPVGAALAAAHPRSWVGNDATAAAWAEHRLGAAAGATDSLTVTLGTGIGGGIVAGGRLLEGARRFAGEFGHVVVDPHGQLCPCGKQGCWERYASGSGLGLLGREAAVAGRAPRVVEAAGGDPEAVRGEHVTVAAAAGDPDALAVVDRFAWWLALGLANLANVFDPEVIVLGGGVIVAGEVLLPPVRAAFAELVEAAGARSVRIVGAALGERAGAVGAASLAAAPGH